MKKIRRYIRGSKKSGARTGLKPARHLTFPFIRKETALSALFQTPDRRIPSGCCPIPTSYSPAVSSSGGFRYFCISAS